MERLEACSRQASFSGMGQYNSFKHVEREEAKDLKPELVPYQPSLVIPPHGIGQASAGMMAYSVMWEAAAMTARPAHVR